MLRPTIRFAAWLIALGVAAALANDVEQTGQTRSPKVAPFVEFADRCAEYERLTRSQSWETVYVADLKRQGPTSWALLNPQAGTTIERVTLDEDRPALRLKVTAGEPGFLRIGPAVSGDFAVEMTARSISDRSCDLSLFTDGINRGPGFQFGGYDNSRNLIWVDAPAEGQSWRAVDVDRTTRIVKDAWHTVRLEVEGGAVRGYVDGKLIGRAALTRSYDHSQRRQPLVYVYGSTAEISRLTTQVLLTRQPVDEAKAMAQAFGGADADAVRRKIEALVKLLDEDDWSTREQAQELLTRIGPLAEPALRQAAERGSAEQRFRARRILGLEPMDNEEDPAADPPHAVPLMIFK